MPDGKRIALWDRSFGDDEFSAFPSPSGRLTVITTDSSQLVGVMPSSNARDRTRLVTYDLSTGWVRYSHSGPGDLTMPRVNSA